MKNILLAVVFGWSLAGRRSVAGHHVRVVWTEW